MTLHLNLFRVSDNLHIVFLRVVTFPVQVQGIKLNDDSVRLYVQYKVSATKYLEIEDDGRGTLTN